MKSARDKTSFRTLLSPPAFLIAIVISCVVRPAVPLALADVQSTQSTPPDTVTTPSDSTTTKPDTTTADPTTTPPDTTTIAPDTTTTPSDSTTTKPDTTTTPPSPAPPGPGPTPTPATPTTAQADSAENALADSLALSATAAVVALFRSESDAVWPGYDLAERPFLVYLPDRWAILVNAPRPTEGFTAYPEDWPPLGAVAILHRGPFKDLAGQLEFNLEIGGIETVAIAPTRGLRAGRRAAIGLGFTFIVHEAFHQFQRDTFQSIPNDLPEEEYPILDSENTALASLEMHILRDALRAAARADTARARESAAEFLAVRKERWNRRPEDIPLFERPQELTEGSAQYVEVRCVGLMGDFCERSAALPTLPPGCDVFAGVTADLYLLADFEDRIGDGVIDPTDMPRNRVYPVGAALGVLLDFFQIDWKTRVSDAATSPGLAELLEQGAQRDLATSDTLLARAKQRYRYDDLRATCDQRVQAYPIEYQAGVDSLKNTPGYHFSMEAPISGMSRSRSCEGRRLVLEKPTRSFSKKCHVYTLKHAAKEDLFVEVRESAIVEENSPEGATRRVDFVTPDVQTVELDGRAVDLGTPGSYSFSRLWLTGSSFQIRYDGEGSLTVDGQQISVRLIPPPPPEKK